MIGKHDKHKNIIYSKVKSAVKFVEKLMSIQSNSDIPNIQRTEI